MKRPTTLLLTLALAITLIGAQRSSAQATDLGVWSAVAAQGSLGGDDSRWRWWFDGHARFFDESDGFDTSIVRPGVGYKLDDNTTAWLGYAWIRNDPPSGAVDEHRVWQQLTWSERYSWGTPFLRTRLEQRFDERDDDVGLRLRQFARWVYPLTEDGRLSVRVWNEIFFDMNDTRWGQDVGFRQNRAFVGLGWALDEAGSKILEFGYLNQHLWRNDARDQNNHVFGVTLLLNF